MAIENSASRMYEILKRFFEDIQVFWIANILVQFVPFDYRRRKKGILKLCFTLNSRIIYSILTSNVKWNIILIKYYPPGIYLLRVNNTNTRTRCEMCSKLRIKTPEQRKWRTFFGWKFARIYFSCIFRDYIFADKISKVCILQGDLFWRYRAFSMVLAACFCKNTLFK